MKTNIFKLTVMMLVLAGGLISCNKKGETGGKVSFKPCPCENNGEVLSKIKGETTLFIDSISVNDANVVEECMVWIGNADNPFLRLKHDNLNLSSLGSLNGGTVFHICNFPDFAKQWNAQGGITVYYEGIVYPYCEEFGCRDLCYSLILNQLKIK